MTQRPPQVYGLGQCCLDYIASIESYPLPDEKCEFSDMVVQGGGPVATALVALARWGLSCYFTGVIGDDPFGSLIKTSLDREGIDTNGVLVREGFCSQFAFIVAEPGIGRRTIFWRRPTGAPPEIEEIDFNMIRQVKVVHTDELYTEATVAACKAARNAGVQVVVDAGSLRDEMFEVARVSDYYLVSEAFAKALTGDDGPIDACRKLAELGPRVVGVTMGQKGYVALAEGRIIERPAYTVESIDTTGCGDIFHAGVTYGVVQGWDVEKSLDFGAWAAAMVSRKLGGRTGIPTTEELADKGY